MTYSWTLARRADGRSASKVSERGIFETAPNVRDTHQPACQTSDGETNELRTRGASGVARRYVR